jgi:hypothetical protein
MDALERAKRLHAAEQQQDAEQAYIAALAGVRGAAANGGPELVTARKALAVAKAKLAKVRRNKPSKGEADNPAWKHYPSPCELPRDTGDPRWVRSFPVEARQEALQFWQQWGFVVFRGVLTTEECDATISEVWSTLEARWPGLARDDQSTYSLVPSKRYGLPDEQAIFTSQIVRNRQSPELYKALDAITPPWPGTHIHGVPETPGPNSIVVSQDRWCMYPPSLGDPNRQTNNPGAHLDICPWSYYPGVSRRLDPETDIEGLLYDGDSRVRQLCDFRAEINGVRGEYGPHNQGLINLLDNEENDGGTALVPCFHRHFREWRDALGRWEDNRVGQRRRGSSFVFSNPRDPIHKLMRRVPMRAGSLLLWNQTLVHGAEPNASSRTRVAQFVRGFRAGEMGSARADTRAQAVRRELQMEGVMGELTELAPHVFGHVESPTYGDILGAVDAIDEIDPEGTLDVVGLSHASGVCAALPFLVLMGYCCSFKREV